MSTPSILLKGEMKRRSETAELKARKEEDAGDSKQVSETVLLKDIPGIEDYFAKDTFDFNIPIDAPLRTTAGMLNENRNALMEACENFSNHDLVELLLKHGADPNAAKIDTSYAKNISILMIAGRLMPARTIETLIEHGADIFAKDSNRHTVLDWVLSRAQPGTIPGNPPSTHKLPDHQLIHKAEKVDFNGINFLPLLAKAYSCYLGEDLQAIFIADGIHFPQGLVSLIKQYSLDMADFSKTFAPPTKEEAESDLVFKPYATCSQLSFLGTLKRAYEIDKRNKELERRNKKLEKLSHCTEEELDRLIAISKSEKVRSQVSESPAGVTEVVASVASPASTSAASASAVAPVSAAPAMLESPAPLAFLYASVSRPAEVVSAPHPFLCAGVSRSAASDNGIDLDIPDRLPSPGI